MSKKPIEQIQNRAQRRKAEKVLKTGKKSKEELNQMINVLNAMSAFDTSNLPKFKECLEEGDRVLLNVEKIRSHPDWNDYDPAYREFVESNEGVVFTVEYDENKRDKPNVVQLREDTSRQKWLFWDGSLLVEHKGKFRDLYTCTIEDGEQ